MEVVLANRKALRSLAVAFGLALPLGMAGVAYADANVSSDNHASNSSDQSADVQTLQGSLSNSGHNSADSSVDGANWTDQDANSDANGGNIYGGTDDTSDNTASNTGGGDEWRDVGQHSFITSVTWVRPASVGRDRLPDNSSSAGEQHVGRQLGFDGRWLRVR
jgi:hypothetical protein